MNNTKISPLLFWNLWFITFFSAVFLFIYGPLIEIPRFILVMLGIFLMMSVDLKEKN